MKLEKLTPEQEKLMYTIRDKAKKMLYSLASEYESTLSDVHWITKNGHSVDGDFCKNCIEKAVENAKLEHEKSRQEILSMYKEIKDTGFFKGEKIIATPQQIEESMQYKLEQLGETDFDSTYNYGGGYECDRFLTCDECNTGLNVSILPSEQNIEYVLEDLEDGIDNRTAYKAYELLYNSWNENDETHKDEVDLLKKLAERVVEIITNKTKLTTTNQNTQ